MSSLPLKPSPARAVPASPLLQQTDPEVRVFSIESDTMGTPTPSHPTGFVLTVTLTEEDARRAGTTLPRVAQALRLQLSAMLPAAETQVVPLHPARAVRRPLFDEVWGGEPPSGERVVDVTVHRLRARLGDWHNVVTTVRGVGYRSVGAPGVRVVQARGAAVPSA